MEDYKIYDGMHSCNCIVKTFTTYLILNILYI
jgi:hypothetical protein